jgi:hypothetical protein
MPGEVWTDPRPTVELGPIAFEHEQPNISVQTTNRVAEHEAINGPPPPGPGPAGDTLRKMGEKPDEIQIKGVCSDSEATAVDSLILDSEHQLISNRWEGDVIVISTSTDPLADGGAVRKQEQFLHNFTISCKGLDGGSPQGGASTYFRGYI